MRKSVFEAELVRKPDVLSLIPAVRAPGPETSERHFLEYKVGRRSLSDVVELGDFISVLGWLPRELEQQHARRLLMRLPAPFRSGRVPIYVCPECGDLGCGAVTARIHRVGTQVTWSDFAQEGPQREPIALDQSDDPREFTFEWDSYRQLLRPYA